MLLPGAMPFTTPVAGPITAIVVLLLLHKPPGTLSVSVVTDPWQTLELPDMVPADGGIFTLMTDVTPAVPQPAVTI